MEDTILIVDDAPANLQVLGQILKSKGYNVVAAMNGKDALTALEKRDDIDLVLLDVMMPELDGFQTCEKIKDSPKSKHIPVIFLTARSEVHDVVEGFDAGGVDYITKPFSSDELLVRVRTHIELKKAREEICALRGVLPICSCCKNIRNDKGYWEQLEAFMSRHSDMSFSHGICPDCVRKLYPDLADEIEKASNTSTD